jgi:uncharacterized protein YbjT (DUF2867 family)
MILVTGPNGNVGTELTNLLVRQKELPYRIASRHPEQLKKTFGADVPTVKLDFLDHATWPKALEGVTSVFMLFPLPHPTTAKMHMVPFVEACAKAGVKHIVYLSVPGGDKYSVIPHFHTEKAIRDSGIPYTILQASYFSQNLTRDISTHWVDIAQHDEIYIPAKNGLHSFIDARDVGEAAVNVMREPAKHRNQTYLITGPENLTFGDVAKIMTEELDRPIRYANPSLPAFWWRMKKRGVTGDVLFFMCLTYLLGRRGKNGPMSDTLPKLLTRPPYTVRDFVRAFKDKWKPVAKDAKLADDLGRGPGWAGPKAGG